MIHVTGLRKQYRNFTALEQLNLEVPQGEIFGFLGPNGAGKTTTIRILTGLLTPTAGQGQVGGVDLRDRQALKQVVGLMPESQGYYGYLTPIAYLRFFGRLYGVAEDELNSRVAALVETVGLTHAQHRPVGQFSRGMRQRLGLARTIIHRPRVVFLDEPSLGLDPQGQRDMQNLIRQINTEWGVTVILTSHLLSEVSQMCDRVGIMNHGQLLAVGNEADLARQLGKEPQVRLDVDDPAKAAQICREAGLAVIGQTADAVSVALAAGRPLLNDLLPRLVAAGIEVRGAVPHVPTLEEVFLALTGAQASKGGVGA